MSSETSPQLLKKTSSQVNKSIWIDSDVLCFQSAVGKFLWVLHRIFTPTISQKLISASCGETYSCWNLSLCFSKATAPKNIPSSCELEIRKISILPKLPKFSTRRHLIQHFPVMQNHNISFWPGVQWATCCCCSLVSWHTVCKRQPWRALSGDTVW